MDSLRTKHVLTEVDAFIKQEFPNLPNLDDHVKRACEEVGCLLLHGEAGYHSLGVAQDYRILATPAEFAKNAASVAARRWNDHMASQGIIGFNLIQHDFADRIDGCITTLEPYFSAHPEKMAAYNAHYRDVGAIIAAKKRVEDDFEPYEVYPITSRDGQVFCGLCGDDQADEAACKSHHKAMHQNNSVAAFTRCTECTWTSKGGRPGDLTDHLQSEHDMYAEGHADDFSTRVGHISRKKRGLLVDLLHEDQAILSTLRGGAPLQANPDWPNWSRQALATELGRIRGQIKTYNNWSQVVRAQRAAKVVPPLVLGRLL